MDAVKFFKEIERMCKVHCDNPYGERDCKGCPLEIGVDECMRVEMEEPEKIVEIVEQWSKEHPEPIELTQLEYDLLNRLAKANINFNQHELFLNCQQKDILKV